MAKKAVPGGLVNRLPLWATGVATHWEHWGDCRSKHTSELPPLRGPEVGKSHLRLQTASFGVLTPGFARLFRTRAKHALAIIGCFQVESEVHALDTGGHRNRKCHRDMGQNGDQCC